MKTHRCEKSLKTKVSIHYTREFPISWNVEDDKETWRLFCHKHSSEYFGYDEIHVAEIEYCPFCNQKLNEESE